MPGRNTWRLNRYGRYIRNTSKGKGQTLDSKIEDDSKGEMYLTLTESKCLVITIGTRVLESHSLATARAWMRGICKTDSLLILYRILNETRRFRVRFAASEDRSGLEVCQDCVEKLSDFFTIQTAGEAKQLQQDISNSSKSSGDVPATESIPIISLPGEVTLSTLAGVVSGQLKAELPAAYHRCDLPREVISTMLQLCLTDASFPAFVETVEKELKAIIHTDQS